MKKHDELSPIKDEKLLSTLNLLIKFAVKVLAFLMVILIFLGIIDVIYVLYKKLVSPPFLLLEISDILNAFAALMAIARKVIILDFADIQPLYVFAISTVVLSLGITYYLIGYKNSQIKEQSNDLADS